MSGALVCAVPCIILDGVITSNENKMSDGGRERASLGVKVWKSSQNWSAQRSAVRSIALLDARSPPVNQTANHEAANAPQNENRNILVSDDSVRKANEQAEEQADQPARPRRQLNATDDEADGETAGECAKQSRGLIGERHRQHQADVESTEYQARDQTKKNFRHKNGFTELALGSQHLRDGDKPQQGVVENPLNSFRSGAVGFIDWLDVAARDAIDVGPSS